MNLGELEYSVDDCDITLPGNVSAMSPYRANQLLRERLEKALQMYTAEGFGHYDRWSANVNDLDSRPSHTARLVCIEEIK